MEEKFFLRTEDLCKSYGSIRVLSGISLTLYPGKVMGLIGENGAGKSTLIKCLNGLVPTEKGSIWIDGKDYGSSMSVAKAGELGIVTIPQEFNLAPDMSVRDNIYLGCELKKACGLLLDHAAMKKGAKELLALLGSRIDPDTLCGSLSVADKQLVEIARGLNRKCRLFILDEPTTVLSNSEVERLFTLIRKMKEKGIAVIYVSHKLYEVKAICDSVTVLRDGEYVGESPIEKLSVKDMANWMVGRALERIFPPKRTKEEEEKGEKILELKNVSRKKLVHNVNLTLHKGEILGLAGLGGSGRTELAEGIFGIEPFVKGEVFLHGKKVSIHNPGEAVKAKIAYLAEDRQGAGSIQDFALRENISLVTLPFKYTSKGFIQKKKEQEKAAFYIEKFGIRCSGTEGALSSLSGGNQQKGVLAKSLDAEPEIFIFDEPTRGIDINSRSDIYFRIHELAEKGTACLVISSDLEEVIGLCRKVAVMHEGTVVKVLEGENVNEKEIMYAATDVKSKNSDQKSEMR